MKNPYAIQGNEIVYIDDVESGLSCNCICPACGGKLIARKGNRNIHHFSHYSTDCGKGYETALHMLAKEILSETNEIVLPSVLLHINGFYKNIELYPASGITIDYVELEKKTDDIIPDIIVHSGGKQLIIEIRVTHKVDNTKLEKIKSLGISALEIDLSKYDRFISKSELKDILINSNKNKLWLYNHIAKKHIEALYDFSEEKNIEHNGMHSYVNDCPISESYADFSHIGEPYIYYNYDCRRCKYLINVKCSHGKHRLPTSIICSGKNGISKNHFKEDLKKAMQKNSLKNPVK